MFSGRGNQLIDTTDVLNERSGISHLEETFVCDTFQVLTFLLPENLTGFFVQCDQKLVIGSITAENNLIFVQNR